MRTRQATRALVALAASAAVLVAASPALAATSNDTTQFAVTAGSLAFTATTPDVPNLPGLTLNGLPQILWPIHCVQGSRGAEFVPGLDMSRVEKVFHKGTDPGIDSYSTFYDNGRRKSTGLEKYLRENEVTDVYIGGLATDYCVLWSARDAVNLGFQTHVIRDACRGVDLKPGDIDRAFNEMRDAGVDVVVSTEV